jgi:hypothetical protein
MPLPARPTTGNREHQTRCDLRRIRQSAPRLVEDERRHREEKHRVGDRGQDLEPQVAECPLAARSVGTRTRSPAAQGSARRRR